MKYKHIYIIIAIFLMGCGARKREMQKVKTKQEVVDLIKFDSVNITDETRTIRKDFWGFQLEPIDSNEPIIFNTDTIFNSKIIYQRVIRDSIVRIRDTVFVSKDIVRIEKKEEETKQVKTERESFNWWGLAVCLLLLGGILYLAKKKP